MSTMDAVSKIEKMNCCRIVWVAGMFPNCNHFDFLTILACERQRVETVKRARALSLPDMQIAVPNCNSIGDFEPVQCNPKSGDCFCVDESGFEVAGTRARSLELVNCSS